MEEEEMSQEQKERSKGKRIALWAALAAAILILAVGACYIYSIVARPKSFFMETVSVTAAPKATATPVFDIEKYLPTDTPAATPEPTAEPTPEPTPTEQPFTGIVNIALFGIDAYENGGSTSGSEPHTDANMIVAVNFDTKDISLISIGRDCFTDIPGHTGFYKFNGVFNVGGGMKDPHAGLELSCRTAEMWLGGMSVPYYYGVDLQALVELVDILGGIDFDSDIRLADLEGNVFAYQGMNHLDGRGVLAYMRMRRTAGGQDYQRTERQRRIMIALFQKLKEEGKLSMIPDLLKTMGDKVYTNTTVAQTTALMSFAQGIDPDNIQSYGIFGGMYGRFDWRFCFIFQQDRIDILKKVYGIDAEPLGVCSPVYEQFLHNRGFLALQHIGYAKRLFDTIHSSVRAEDMIEEQKKLYAACWKDYTDLQDAYEKISTWTKEHYIENQKLTVEENRTRYDYNLALIQLEEKLRKSGDALNRAFGSPVKLHWLKDVKDWYRQDSVINEVYVDFA